ncbi:hypothetical protein NTGM5_700001 [Candidatus Nitrotoga sp. M5]|nr:hypothetical protein NTGM5_700001 [Candidatus Nitrotoga sp. M5]
MSIEHAILTTELKEKILLTIIKSHSYFIFQGDSYAHTSSTSNIIVFRMLRSSCTCR